MDNKQDILELLRKVAEGKVSPEDAMLDLKEAPFEDLDYAKIDFHRSVRQGAAEVIYGAGKTPEQIRGIVCTMGERGCRNILVTRDRSGGGRLLKRDDPGSIITLFPDLESHFPRSGKTGTYRGGYRRDQ